MPRRPGNPSPYGQAWSQTRPPPVAWDASRDDRGARRDPPPPKCTTKGCPVVYRDGPPRPCREHSNEAETDAAESRIAGYRCGQPGQDDEDKG